MLIFQKVAVAVSGGVDSAVAALILRNKGFDVTGIFIRCWDQRNCSDDCIVDEDAKSAKWVCDRLGVPFQEINLVKEYWTHVFENTIADYNVGFKPNPGIVCNEFIKFGHYQRYCFEKLRVDAVATGHYARSSYGLYLENYDPTRPVKLLRSVDTSVDQSFFLARISHQALRRTMFPVGTLTRFEVEKMARENSLGEVIENEEKSVVRVNSLENLESFISKYVSDEPGKFVDVDSGEVIGEHAGTRRWIIGQRCPNGYSVVDKDRKNNIVFVASSNSHPALICRTLMLSSARWIANKPQKLSKDRIMRCNFQYMLGMPLLNCSIVDLSSFPEGGCIFLNSEEPIHAAAPGQYAVLYDSEECLGCARIINTGLSDLFTRVCESQSVIPTSCT